MLFFNQNFNLFENDITFIHCQHVCKLCLFYKFLYQFDWLIRYLQQVTSKSYKWRNTLYLFVYCSACVFPSDNHVKVMDGFKLGDKVFTLVGDLLLEGKESYMYMYVRSKVNGQHIIWPSCIGFDLKGFRRGSTFLYSFFIDFFLSKKFWILY